jgi:hypothetical protein
VRDAEVEQTRIVPTPTRLGLCGMAAVRFDVEPRGVMGVAWLEK